MKTPRDTVLAWMLQVMKERDWTGAEMARRAGVYPSTIHRFIRGASKSIPSTTTLSKIALAAGMPAPTFSDGNHSQTRATVPLIGYVGGGAEVHPINDHPAGHGFDDVEMPPGEFGDLVAVVVSGDSMMPLYHEGDIIYFRPVERGVDEAQCLNRPCIVKIHEGPTLVKVPIRGSSPKHYTLMSYAGSPRENQRLDWASKVLWVKHK